MNLTITRMSRPEAAEYLAWQYPDPTENIEEADWADQLDDIFADNGEDYYAVYDGDTFIGMVAYAFPEGYLTFDAKLAPEFEGHGFDQAFLQAGIDFARERFHYHDRIDVTAVARAVAVYEALGFVPQAEVAGKVLMRLDA